jgi:hypothetical protein
MTPASDWLDGLRDFVHAERSVKPPRPIATTPAATAAERSIIGGSLTTRLAELDALREARRSLPPGDPDPAIVITTSAIGCAAIASFPAREVVLGALGVIYNLGDVDTGEEEGATALVRRLRAATWDGSRRKVFTLPVALSIMVFFALCAQCASTLVVIGRETGSWVWPVVSFTSMTVLAWLAAMITYQVGTFLLA